MKNYDSFVIGIFTGILVASWFMMMWPKERNCYIKVGSGQVKAVTVGVWRD